MRAAVLHEHGATPELGEFDDPGETSGAAVVDVAAAALHHLDLHKATGTFYTGPPPLPSVVGSDGVGRLGDGRRVYFDATVAPHGSMAEHTLSPDDAMLDVAEGLDDALAAALGNTGLAAGSRSRGAPGSSRARRCSCSARPARSGASPRRPRSCSAPGASSPRPRGGERLEGC